jgi:membrane protein YdbS with pleckstrin-like domain
MKGKTKAIITVFVVILAGIYYYAAIPAINIHSSETWFFIMIFLVILAVLYLGRKKLNRYEVRESKVVKGFLDSVSRSCISVGNTVFFSGY